MSPTLCLGSAAAPFVTEAQASQVMTALWNGQERAHVGKNTTLYDELDAGSVDLEEHYALDDLICGCSSFYWTKGKRILRHVAVYLPRQTSYPLSFFAEVLATAPGAAVPPTGATADFVVTRDSPSDPWKLTMQSFDGGYGPPVTELPAPELIDGYDSPTSQPESVPRAWPAQLAAYYNGLKRTGVQPTTTPFLPGPLTTGTDLTTRTQGYTTTDGVVGHYRFAVTGDGAPWVFTIGGMTASCADISEYVTSTLANPHTVFDQIDGTKGNWGPDLDTGFYSKIVTTWDWPVCVINGTDPAHPDGLYVFGPSSGGYPIHDGGVPAKPGPGTTRIL